VYYNGPEKEVQICDGTTFVPVYLPPLGSPQRPAGSCQSIVEAGDSSGSGVYTLDVAGDKASA
jgi:hypothetical protein